MGFTTPTMRVPDRTKLLEGARAHLHRPQLRQIAMNSLAVVTLFFVSAAVGLGLYAYTHVDRVYQGVRVAGVEVGGMTEAEARAEIEAAFGSYLGQPLELTFEGETFTVVPSAAGIALDVDATVDAAMAVGREGSVWSRSRTWSRTLLRGSEVPASLSVNEAQLDRSLMRFSDEIARPPANAFIQVSGDQDPAIVPEVPGVAFDLGTTKANVIAHLSVRTGGALPVVAPELPASVKKEDLAPRLAEVQQAVDSTLLLSGLGKFWAVGQEDLKRIVSVPGPGEPVQINRLAIEELVQGIAAEIDHPPVDARLYVDSEGTIRVRASDQSVSVRVDETVDGIISALSGGTHEVDLSIERDDPAISDAQAEAARVEAETLVANGLTVKWDGGSVQLGSADLIAALTVSHQPGEEQPISLGFSPEVMASILGPIASEIDVQPKNGRYRWVDGVVKLVEKGSNGQAVDVGKSAETIIDAVMDGKDSAELTVEKLKPEFSSSSAKKIKLPDVLATAATYYGNSSDARRTNVERGVDLQTGWLVAPGDTFSFNANVGKIDEKNGFVTGLGILSDGAGGITTAPVVGGGICQVSTTVFQAAFWSGLTIVERTAHPYWLQNYGQPPSGMKGLDAMINIDDDPWLTLDLKFQNNTGNWIAIVMYADGQNVTAQVLGTNPGWDIKVDAEKITNIVDPPTEPFFQDSPEIPAGEERQVESAQQGFDATIRRVVTDKEGNLVEEFVYTSTYVPSVNRILRGTGS